MRGKWAKRLIIVVAATAIAYGGYVLYMRFSDNAPFEFLRGRQNQEIGRLWAFSHSAYSDGARLYNLKGTFADADEQVARELTPLGYKKSRLHTTGRKTSVYAINPRSVSRTPFSEDIEVKADAYVILHEIWPDGRFGVNAIVDVKERRSVWERFMRALGL